MRLFGTMPQEICEIEKNGIRILFSHFKAFISSVDKEKREKKGRQLQTY